MIKNDKILERIYGDVDAYLNDAEQEHAEARRSYQYMHGHQYDDRVMRDRLSEKERKAFISVDLSSPIIKSISGSEMMSDTSIDVVSVSGRNDKRAEVKKKWVHTANEIGMWDYNKSLAVRDSIISGIGCVVDYNDYSFGDFPAGKPIVDHIPRLLAFHDRSGMGKNINENARWCGYHDIITTRNLDEYMEMQKGAKNGGDGAYRFSFDVSRVLNGLRHNFENIELITHYFYSDFEPRYDVQNPATMPEYAKIITRDKVAEQVLSEAIDRTSVTIEAPYWSLTKEEYDTINEAMIASMIQAGAGYEGLPYSKRMVKTYYRVEIARGQIIRHERSPRQNGHMMVFWQGDYDDTTNSFYGLMRNLSGVQDIINLTLNQIVGYASIDMRGGRVWLKGDTGAAAEYVRQGVEKQDVSYLGDVSAQLEVIPKNKADSLQSSINLLTMMIPLLPKTLGMDEMSLFGVVESGDMTSDLFSKSVKQSRAVLSHIMSSSSVAVQHQAHCMIALGRSIVEVMDGYMFKSVDDGGEYLALTKQDITGEYDIRTVEREMTADERQQTFLMLKDAVGGLPPEAQMAALPTLFRYSRLDSEGKDELIKAITPQPPQANPLNEEILKSQIALQYAQAQKLSAEAKEKTSIIPLAPDKMQSEIDKNNAQAAKQMYG